MIDAPTTLAARLFLKKVRMRHPDADAVLFGSRARGDFHAESDVDIAVLLPTAPPSRMAAAVEMADMAFDVLLETGLLIAPLPFSRAEFAMPDTSDSPALVEAIRREGVRL